MDLAITVLEGHKEEVDKMTAELETLKDKLEDAENRARRDNLCIRGIPEVITDLQGTVTAFSRNWPPISQWRGSSSTISTGPCHLNPQMTPQGMSLLNFTITVPKRNFCRWQETSKTSLFKVILSSCLLTYQRSP